MLFGLQLLWTWIGGETVATKKLMYKAFPYSYV